MPWKSKDAACDCRRRNAWRQALVMRGDTIRTAEDFAEVDRHTPQLGNLKMSVQA
jgi:hypothetical protein